MSSRTHGPQPNGARCPRMWLCGAVVRVRPSTRVSPLRVPTSEERAQVQERVQKSRLALGLPAELPPEVMEEVARRFASALQGVALLEGWRCCGGE